jgi:hypothetical protein
MKQSNHGEWVRSSSTPSRAERLKAHEEFEASDLKKMLDNDWKITAVRKSRRPRIHKEPTPKRIKVQAGFITITVEYADWVANGSVGRIIERY